METALEHLNAPQTPGPDEAAGAPEDTGAAGAAETTEASEEAQEPADSPS